MWSVQEFLDKNEDACRQAAIELNRKSQMVEEAVEEVLDLVQKASVIFRNMIGAENDIFGDEEQRMHSAEYRENDDAGGTGQQQDWSLLYSCFENPLSLFTSYESGLPKGMQDMVFNAIHEMRRYYSRKVIDVLIKVTRAALDLLRRRFVSESEADINQKPIYILNAILMIPNIAIRPSLDDLQEALVLAGKNLAGVSKGVAQWNSGSDEGGTTTLGRTRAQGAQGDERSKRRKMYRVISEQKPQMPHMTKSFYNYVMDNKEVVKTLSLLSTCTRNLKHDLAEFVKKWKPYHFLWKCDKTIRQLLEYNLMDFEANLRCLGDLDGNLSIEPDMECFGQSVCLSTNQLKFGLAIEIKAFRHKIAEAMKKKYKREMDYVYAVINEMDHKLDRPIRDLDDVRMIMDTLGKIREQEVDMELKIDPIEEAFNTLAKYDIPVERTHSDLVDNLRDTWYKLKNRALDTHCKLLEMQPIFQTELCTNLDRFKQEKIDYVDEYNNTGPMQPGLTPREASDKLILFQVTELNVTCYFLLHLIHYLFRIASMACGEDSNYSRTEKSCSDWDKLIILSLGRLKRNLIYCRSFTSFITTLLIVSVVTMIFRGVMWTSKKLIMNLWSSKTDAESYQRV